MLEARDPSGPRTDQLTLCSLGNTVNRIFLLFKVRRPSLPSSTSSIHWFNKPMSGKTDDGFWSGSKSVRVPSCSISPFPSIRRMISRSIAHSVRVNESSMPRRVTMHPAMAFKTGAGAATTSEHRLLVKGNAGWPSDRGRVAQGPQPLVRYLL